MTETEAIKKFEPMISVVLRLFPAVSGVSRDDWFQTGRIGIIKALRSYSTDRVLRGGGGLLSSFVFVFIRREMIGELRKANRRRKQHGAFVGPGACVTEVVELNSDMAPSPSFGPQIEARCDIDTLSRGLSPRHKLLVNRRYLEDATQAVMALELGVSPGRISQLERRALEIMRTAAGG